MNSQFLVESRGRQYQFGEPGHVRTAVSGDLAGLTSPIARDLFRLGQGFMIADRAIRRFNRDPFRSLRIVVHLEDPETWEPLRTDLQQLAGFSTHDRWALCCARLNSTTGGEPEPPSDNEWTLISLFSDGLDSLCGAARAVDEGEIPLFVSHVPPAAERGAVLLRRLSEALDVERARDDTVGVRFTVSGSLPERSRRTRPIFFLSMAGAVAVDTGIPVIRLNENGVLAANLPLRVDFTGYVPSRHAHPGVLRRFEHILRSIWPHQSTPRVENPFQHVTKGEGAAELATAPELIGETVTCEYARQQVSRIKGWMTEQGIPGASDVKECGLCHPCLIRRAALCRAGLPDPEERYAFDATAVFRGEAVYGGWPLYSNLAPNVSELHRFGRSLLDSTAADFMLEYLPYLVQIYRPEGVTKGGERLYALYQRFGEEVVGYLEGDGCRG